ncbi:MAG: GumC family protein [Acidiferrobacterales bacterium]
MIEEAIEPTKDLRDYVDALRRRRKGIAIVTGALFLASVLVAFLLPPVYRSTATILIQEQEIPQNMIRSTITSYAWQRIQTISQQVMTRANLLDLVNKYNLYPDKRRSETNDEIVRRMQNDIRLEAINADVIDPQTGQPRPATIAFKLSYDGETPTIAQKVANELMTLYLNENLKTRAEQATGTYDFLSNQARKLKEHIADLEAKMAAFKEKNLNSLPDVQQLNMQLMDRSETDLLDTNNQIRSLEERKTFLEGQLAQIDPNSPMTDSNGNRILDPVSQLKVLKTQYATALAEYSPDYPDVVELRREIAGLEKQVGPVSGEQDQAKEATRLRTELAAARKKYSDDYPDVVRLKNELAALETQMKQKPTTPEAAIAAEKPENPAYITLNAQLEGVNADMQAMVKKREQLNAKVANYEKWLANTPQVEREYRDLARDYQNSQRQYESLKGKQMDAQVGQQMEKDSMGERFSPIDPPDLPQKPVKPNRLAIVILGLFLSVGGGLGYAAVAENIDKSVHDTRGIAAIIGAAPLSIIPYIENSVDLARREKTKRLAITSALAGLIVAVLLVQFFWIPWDVLWFKGLRVVSGIVGG